MNKLGSIPGFRNEYFVWLLPAFFVLHGLMENFPLLHLGDIMFLLGWYLLVSLALIVVCSFLLKSWRKSALYVFLLLAFYFFFGSVYDFVQSFLQGSFVLKYIFIIPFTLCLFAGIFIYLKRSHHQFNRLAKYLNVLLLVLILLDGVHLVLKLMTREEVNSHLPKGFSQCDTCSKPDIYLIVADGYAGKRELKDIFGFDNVVFENELKQRGFHVIDSTVSNYNYTPFSMASLFSMNYVENIEGRNKSKKDRQICYDLINKNPTLDFLRSQGYDIQNLSVFQLNNELPQAHSSFFLTGINMLKAQTFFSRIDRDIRFNLVTKLKLTSELKRMARTDLDGIESLFQKTKKIAGSPHKKPMFIYTHLMMPHYPYFYDQNGKSNPLEEYTNDYFMKTDKYLGYLQFANIKLLELIDHIQSKAVKPPVIIVMSDHGFREFANDTVDHQYHFMNLSAIKLPSNNYHGFYTGMSMVNHFRVLLNNMFKQQFPILKDSSSFLVE